MRQDQIKYVTARAESIYNERLHVLRRKYTTPAKSFSNKEKAQALADGRFTVDIERVSDDRYSGGWSSGVSFPEEHDSKLDEKYYVEANKVRDQFNKLMDELMVGDNTQALALLRTFENG